MKSSSYNLIMSALFNGRKGERPPVGNPTSIVCHGLMDAAGVTFPEAHLNANAMAELAINGTKVRSVSTSGKSDLARKLLDPTGKIPKGKFWDTFS